MNRLTFESGKFGLDSLRAYSVQLVVALVTVCAAALFLRAHAAHPVLPLLGDALLVTGSGTRDAIEGSDYYGLAADRQYASFQDFKAYARPGGFLLVPLRLLPPGLAITFPDSVTLDPQTAPVAVTQHVAFGFPCWRVACPITP